MATAARNDVPGNELSRPVQYRFPPGFQRNLLWFAFRKFRPANPILLFRHLTREYGDIAHYKIGWHHIVFLNHPDYIREVLVVQNDNFIKERTVQRTKMLLGQGMITAEGAQHRTQRQVAQPAFHRQRIPEYAAVMVREAASLRDRWRDGEQRDVAIDMMHLTLNVVAQTLFATDLREEVDELADAINRIMGLYNFLVMLPAAEWLVHVRPPGLAAFVRARKRIDACRLSHDRGAPAVRRSDGSLLDHDAGCVPRSQCRASEQSLRDQVITIFLAGYETVANALSWTWYLLSQNPDCERQFHEDIDRELQGRVAVIRRSASSALCRDGVGGVDAARTLQRGPWDATRAMIFSWEISFCRRRRPCLMSQFVTHRDARFFPDPLRFDPERFTPEAKAQAREIHLLSVRRGSPPVHRRIVRVDGGCPAARDVWARSGS